MENAVMTFYQSILQQVLKIEVLKKELSREILICRDKKSRLKLINSFLQYDLKKHELLEHAAVVAAGNEEMKILDDIRELYVHTGKNEDTITIIREEITLVRQFLYLIENAFKPHSTLNFLEKRMAQEVEKYVTEQAKIYNSSKV